MTHCIDEVVSIDPATGNEIFRAPAASAAQVDAAVEAAHAEFASWAQKSFAARAAVLNRFADLVDKERDKLARLIRSEVGKLDAEARSEAEWTAITARFYVEHPPADRVEHGARIAQRPIGLIAALTPWNVPLVTPSWKWLPALMAGNTVVWKPSEYASATAQLAVELLREAGLPADALTLVLGGAEQGQRLVRDPRVAGIHFTGSTAAGCAINATAAPRLARVALELGGVNTALILEDADIEAAARDITASAVAINGQKCTATRRVLIQQSIFERVVTELGDQFANLNVGDPRDPTTDVGPLIHRGALAAAQTAIDKAVTRGARIVARAAAPTVQPEGSSFFRPTLLANIEPGDPLEREEVFAPVVSLQPFADLTEAAGRVDSSDYGLAAAVYTADESAAQTAAALMPTGVININGRSDSVGLELPFGGRRRSGNGFPEGGAYVYSALTDAQVIYGHTTDEESRP